MSTATQDDSCSNVEESNGIVLPSCDKYENEDLDGNKQKKCSNVGEYNGIVLPRYDKYENEDLDVNLQKKVFKCSRIQ